jgi:hypothetical protein
MEGTVHCSGDSVPEARVQHPIGFNNVHHLKIDSDIPKQSHASVIKKLDGMLNLKGEFPPPKVNITSTNIFPPNSTHWRQWSSFLTAMCL